MVLDQEVLATSTFSVRSRSPMRSTFASSTVHCREQRLSEVGGRKNKTKQPKDHYARDKMHVHPSIYAGFKSLAIVQETYARMP